jgi:hypothetical protein
LGLTLIAWQLISLLNVSPGLVGYDYVYFLPRLLEGVLFFRAQGLAAPLYSSFFCGGFPYHADPQVMFYSLPQFLSFIVEPWAAVQYTAVLYLIIGAIAAYLLSLRVFGLHQAIGIFVALSFAANGFSRSRLLIGHLTYHPFSLLPLAALLLLDKRIRNYIAAPGLGIIAALIIQAGGNYNAPITAISLLLCAALCLAINAPGACTVRQISERAIFGALVALALSASKIVAGLSLTSHHPRLTKFDSLASYTAGLKLIFSQFFLPGAAMPFKWGLWEYDSSLSLLVGLGLFIAAFFFLKRFTKAKGIQFISAISFILLLLLLLSFSSGTLPAIQSLRIIPIIEQMRVNIRFTSAAILPLILFAAWGFNQTRVKNYPLCFVLVALVFSLLPGEQLREKAVSYMSFSLEGTDPFYQNLKYKPLNQLKITAIAGRGGDDWQSLRNWQTNPSCYSVLFSTPPTHRLKTGPVDKISDGTFNFLNPACYVYPEENQCYAGHRIRETDRENFELLLAHRNPHWESSSAQYFADWVNTISFYLICGYFLLIGIKFLAGFLKEIPSVS